MPHHLIPFLIQLWPYQLQFQNGNTDPRPQRFPPLLTKYRPQTPEIPSSPNQVTVTTCLVHKRPYHVCIHIVTRLWFTGQLFCTRHCADCPKTGYRVMILGSMCDHSCFWEEQSWSSFSVLLVPIVQGLGKPSLMRHLHSHTGTRHWTQVMNIQTLIWSYPWKSRPSGGGGDQKTPVSLSSCLSVADDIKMI